MDDIDRTYEALIRTPFNAVVDQIYAADPYGSYTFSRMNQEKVWRVCMDLEYICVENGWTVEEFNAVLNREFNDNQ